MMKDIGDSNFSEEVLKCDTPVMVDFYATWCGPCKQIEPILNELGDENSSKLKIVKLNVDEQTKTAQAYEVMSVPTILFFNKGQVVNNVVGYMEKSKILEKINSL